MNPRQPPAAPSKRLRDPKIAANGALHGCDYLFAVIISSQLKSLAVVKNNDGGERPAKNSINTERFQSQTRSNLRLRKVRVVHCDPHAPDWIGLCRRRKRK